MTGHTPTPLILDTTVLHELARGDTGTIGLVQAYDAQGQPMVVPALAITQTLLNTPTEEATAAMYGLAMLETVTVAALKDSEHATALAEVITVTGLDVWDAHTAAIADASICPVLTMDATAWQRPASALNERLHIIEIADSDHGK